MTGDKFPPGMKITRREFTIIREPLKRNKKEKEEDNKNSKIESHYSLSFVRDKKEALRKRIYQQKEFKKVFSSPSLQFVDKVPNTTFLLSSQGELYGLGQGKDGQMGNGSFISLSSIERIVALQGKKVIKVSCSRHVLCVTDEGVVYSWGLNDFGKKIFIFIFLFFYLFFYLFLFFQVNLVLEIRLMELFQDVSEH